MADVQGFSIPLNPADPMPRFATLIGTWQVYVKIDSYIPDVVWGWDELINLSERHPSELTKPSPISPKRTRLTAAVGLASFNNVEAPQWTWEIYKVEPYWEGDVLKLRVGLGAQGGPDDPDNGLPIIGKISYCVSVLVM